MARRPHGFAAVAGAACTVPIAAQDLLPYALRSAMKISVACQELPLRALWWITL
jgi:hypothetical protein